MAASKSVVPRLDVDWSKIPIIAKAMKEAAPQHLLRSMGKAFYRIGRSDITKMKAEQLSGSGQLRVKNKGLLNSFKFKASDARKINSLDELILSEYTGSKPMRIWQTGGTIVPRKARTLTVLTDAARRPNGQRRYQQKQIKAMLASGQARIINIGGKPAVILEKISVTKTGKLRKGSRVDILAWLVRHTKQRKRIDFFRNFESNAAAHDEILTLAAGEAIEKTLKEMDKGGK